MAYYVMPGGAQKNPVVKVKVPPAGLACEMELYLGLTPNSKAASSGKKPFTSTAEDQNVACPITLPTTPGMYHVYIDVTTGGQLLKGFIDIYDIAIADASIGGVTWD